MSATEPSFYFYDLETTGFDSRSARIVQFAGQRTNMELEPIGEPLNVLIKITPDILPDPDATLITGITPQATLADGVTEAEFLKLFYEQAVQPNTTFLGFNSIRFDDEFMRFLHYRNFYDAYEWQWKEGCSRWDLLDVVRMTRALRPDGITWPFAPDGRPANRLELLSSVNNLTHDQAHDALSDVHATIAVAKLIHDKQPDLFQYLFAHRSKDKIKAIVDQPGPFVYTTGRYSSECLHTSAAIRLSKHPNQDAALVYDLRFDPSVFIDKSPAELVEHWRFSKDPEHVRLPVKTLKYNRCPTVAPLGVLNEDAQKRLGLPMSLIEKNLKVLKTHQKDFAQKIFEALQILDKEREATQTQLIGDESDVDNRLYDGFFDAKDKTAMSVVRAARPEELSGLELDAGERLTQLLPLYKARNFPNHLSNEEKISWEAFCRQRLQGGGAKSRLQQFAGRLQQLAEDPSLSDEKRYLLEELQLYAESIIVLPDL